MGRSWQGFFVGISEMVSTAATGWHYADCRELRYGDTVAASDLQISSPTHPGDRA